MIWLLLACTGGEAEVDQPGVSAELAALQVCEDQPCRADAAGAAWEADRAGVEAWLRGLDEFERVPLVDVLAHRFPADSAALCEVLEKGTAGRSRCEKRNVRPHLTRGEQTKNRHGSVSTTGPRSSDLPVLAVGEPPWEGVSQLALDEALGPCTQGSRCVQDRARDLGAQGAGGQALLTCAAGEPAGTSRHECVFQAIEGIAESGDIEQALGLCGHAGQFAPMCVAHSLQLAAPGPSQGTSPAIAYGDELGELGDEGRLYEDWFWASWTYSAVMGGASVGQLAAELPESVAPHVRAAGAWAVVSQRVGGFDETLKVVQARLEQGDSVRLTGDRIVARTTRSGWQDLPGEEELATVFLFGPLRRALAEDPEVDLQVALLEAAYQLEEPPDASWFAAQITPERDPVVRWTAARILSKHDPSALDGIDDQDELVRIRIHGPTKKKKILKGGKGPAPRPQRKGPPG